MNDGNVGAAYRALEVLLADGLGRMSPEARAASAQRVLEGCSVEFQVRMGDGAFFACSIAAPDGERAEIFRVMLGEPDHARSH